MRRRYLLPVMVLILLLAIPACGRKGDPRPPEKVTLNVIEERGT